MIYPKCDLCGREIWTGECFFCRLGTQKEKKNQAPKTNYSVREWLNPIESEATGSVVAFDGMVKRRWESEPQPVTFLEIADCNGKVNLHEMPSDGKAAFIAKMRLLANVATEFADYLECKGQE